ncbi:hypothetical protein NC653_028444 [Populus alba x Populus x berolinensis]|uniref:Uncharacterized protein n=1 Tax=Populus alba x Populus x berolinensis TaxID=444605 RepID=A0AAD6Q679_9ROSI|nr:hypothetical protein NC653_028444 [Populus alba x Populus x berolinensis]
MALRTCCHNFEPLGYCEETSPSDEDLRLKPVQFEKQNISTRSSFDKEASRPGQSCGELDRRNGTSWATMSSLPAQATEKSDAPKEVVKKPRVLPIHPEDCWFLEVEKDGNGEEKSLRERSSDVEANQNLVIVGL